MKNQLEGEEMKAVALNLGCTLESYGEPLKKKLTHTHNGCLGPTLRNLNVMRWGCDLGIRLLKVLCES